MKVNVGDTIFCREEIYVNKSTAQRRVDPPILFKKEHSYQITKIHSTLDLITVTGESEKIWGFQVIKSIRVSKQLEKSPILFNDNDVKPDFLWDYFYSINEWREQQLKKLNI